MKLEHTIKRWQIEKRLRNNGSRVASVATEFARTITRRRRKKKALRRNAGRIAAAFGGAVVGYGTWRAMRAH